MKANGKRFTLLVAFLLCAVLAAAQGGRAKAECGDEEPSTAEPAAPTASSRPSGRLFVELSPQSSRADIWIWNEKRRFVQGMELAAGEHRLAAWVKGYDIAEAVFTIEPGKDAAVDLRLMRPPRSPDGSPPTRAYDLGHGARLEMLYIPEGRYVIHDYYVSALLPPVERPITLQGFFMGRFEVTRAQFSAFVKETGYKTDAETRGYSTVMDFSRNAWRRSEGASWRRPGFPQTDRDPVACVSENDAEAFLSWLRAKTGKPFRLPRRIEWEYADKGESPDQFFFGYTPSTGRGYGNIPDASYEAARGRSIREWDDGYVYTAPAGTFKPNPFGLYDTFGNVSEYCAENPTDRIDPTGGRPRSRLIWCMGWSYGHAAIDAASNPAESRSDRGFRVLCPNV